MAKTENQGQFRNPQDQQISKLTLLFEFGEDLMELLTKNKLYSFFVDTVYIEYFKFNETQAINNITTKKKERFYSLSLFLHRKIRNNQLSTEFQMLQ